MSSKELIQGFSPPEAERITRHFERLIPNLQQNRFVVVGGLAIRSGLSSRGMSYPNRKFNDIDLAAQAEDVVKPSITKDFLVYHHHPDFYFAFVDPVSKTKVDIFDWSKPPIYTEEVDFEGQKISIQSLEDQLTVTVLDILRASNVVKRDPKMIVDMRLMLSVADIKKVNQIWRKRGGTENFLQALENTQNLFRDHPEFFKVNPWHKPKPYKCKACINVPDFPLTPMENIYKILGHIE